MATITPVVPVLEGALKALVATVTGGDQMEYAPGTDLLIEFFNGHVSSITVNIVPTQATGRVPGAGLVTIPTRSLAIGAGLWGSFLLKAEEVKAYLNAQGRIPLTYTSGNVALLLRGYTIEK